MVSGHVKSFRRTCALGLVLNGLGFQRTPVSLSLRTRIKRLTRKQFLSQYWKNTWYRS
ncbi:hypothetical protein CCP3SC1_1360005 [Gammaproteobacteria bacterium]